MELPGAYTRNVTYILVGKQGDAAVKGKIYTPPGIIEQDGSFQCVGDERWVQKLAG